MKIYCLVTHLNFRPPHYNNFKGQECLHPLVETLKFFLFSKLLSKKCSVISNFAHKNEFSRINFIFGPIETSCLAYFSRTKCVLR
eukprot:UN03757